MSIINQMLSNKIRSWDDIYFSLIELQNSSKSGLSFEEFAKLYFQFEPVVKDDYINIWLHNEIPLEIKQKLNLTTIDHGIDLLLETVLNEYVAVQCKFRIDQDSSLSWSKDKIANLFAYGDKCDKFIVFSNCSKLDNVSANRKENFEFINIDNLLQIKETTYKNIFDYVSKGLINDTSKYTPKDHQKEAIEKVAKYFENRDRGQLILPCGAGKTLTALWIQEKLEAQNILVLVPSLALLKQIKNSWNEQKNEFYKYLCVCSEKDIDSDKYDSPITHTYEIGGNVTTDKNKIKDFLIQGNGRKVIFSTYQSLIQIKEAIKNTDFSFDLAICDEAHKTSGGKLDTTFSLIHSNENIPVKKRLYMTATPRVLSEKLKKSLGSKAEELLYDMGNEQVYGKEIFRMSFKDAIDLGILVDYKILGIGVSDQEIAEYLQKRSFVTDKDTIEDYANNYALELVMNKYKASHAISFHSRVKFAQTFSDRQKKLFDDVYCQAVSGEQTTIHRNLILNEFKNKQKGLVSNARCLTEGVDVPVIDLVYFADPKNSKIDIVQASGRALRIDKHGNKKLGYIVVPIFHHKNKDIDKAIDEGVFRNLVNVVRSLCDQDERLQDEINKLAFKKGKRTALGERLEVVFDEAEERVVNLIGFEEKLKNALFDQVIEKASNNWGVKYDNLKLWREVYPNKWPQQIPPKRRKENTPAIIEENSLGVWLMGIRKFYREGSLDQVWINRFNELGFIWDYRELRRDSIFAKLENFLNKKNRFPTATENNNFYNYLRNNIENYEQRNLEQKYLDLLDKHNFQEWIKEYRRSWDDWLQEVVDYKNKFGKWPASTRDKHSSTYSIGSWLNSMRQKYRAGELDQERVDKMFAVGIGFTHKKVKDKAKWEKHFEEVKKWYQEKSEWPKFGSEDKYENKLGQWILYQKNWLWGNSVNKSKYPKERKEKLESIGISFEKSTNRKLTAWEKQFDNLEEFRKQNPDKWPTSSQQFPKHNNLGAWCHSQRQSYRKGKLKTFRIEMLESIGFEWGDTISYIPKTWEERFKSVELLLNKGIKIDYKTYKSECFWIYKQKQKHKEGKLDEEKVKLLKSLDLIK